MRNLMRGVTALALLALTASAASAAGYTYKWVQVPFCTRCGAGADVQEDSLSFYAPNSADVQDTSVVIPLPGFVVPVAADSMPEFVLVIEKSAAGAAGDTVYAVVQPSVGGGVFTEPTWLPTYNVVNGAVKAGSYGFRLATSYATSTNWTNVAPKFGVIAARVRLYWDGTAAMSNGGTVSVKLGYLVAKGSE